jgi:hypothetical protein
MGNLVSPTNGSLDFLIEDEHRGLDWRAPSVEPIVYPTNLIRPLGPQRYGWQLHKAMASRETSPELAAQSDLTAESACIWAAASRETSR